MPLMHQMPYQKAPLNWECCLTFGHSKAIDVGTIDKKDNKIQMGKIVTTGNIVAAPAEYDMFGSRFENV